MVRVDIACNITSFPENSLEELLERAKVHQTIPIFVGTDIKTSKRCIALADKYDTVCYAGIHPTSTLADQNTESLQLLYKNNSVVAAGECGLDYDRLQFAPVETQKKVFIKQLEFQQPLYFLHSRNCHRDFMEIISDYFVNGVVHSFTGTCEEAEELIKKGLYIGINGCSVRNENNLEVVKSIPLDRMMIETDAPYCKIKRSSSGFEHLRTFFDSPKILKKQNEPCCVIQVAEVIASLKNMSVGDVEASVYQNTLDLFGPKLERVVNKWIKDEKAQRDSEEEWR